MLAGQGGAAHASLSHCVRDTRACIHSDRHCLPPVHLQPPKKHVQLVCQHLPLADLRCARLASSAWCSAASSTVRVVQHTPEAEIKAPLQEFPSRVTAAFPHVTHIICQRWPPSAGHRWSEASLMLLAADEQPAGDQQRGWWQKQWHVAIKPGGHGASSPLEGLAFWQGRLPVRCSCASIIAPAEEPPLGASEVGRPQTPASARAAPVRVLCEGCSHAAQTRICNTHASSSSQGQANTLLCLDVFDCSGPSWLGDCRSSRACTQAWPTQSSLVGGAACWAGVCLEASGSCTCTALAANPSGEVTAAQQHSSKAAWQHTAQQAQQAQRSHVGACFLACSRGHIPSWAGTSRLHMCDG